MSAAFKLLDDLAQIGATIEAAGGRLILRAGLVPIPADLTIRIRQTKAGIMALLCPKADGWSAGEWRDYFDERAGVFEYDGNMPRAVAEAQAFKACVVEWLTRNPAASPEGSCAFCGEVETINMPVLPRGSAPGPYAWVHGECWLPWQDSRHDAAVKALRELGGIPNAAQSGLP